MMFIAGGMLGANLTSGVGIPPFVLSTSPLPSGEEMYGWPLSFYPEFTSKIPGFYTITPAVNVIVLAFDALVWISVLIMTAASLERIILLSLEARHKPRFWQLHLGTMTSLIICGFVLLRMNIIEFYCLVYALIHGKLKDLPDSIYRMAIVDFLISLAALVVIGSICEAMIRRREIRQH